MGTSLLLIAALAATASAGPTVPRTELRCAAYCLGGSDSKLDYQPGRTYVYQYSSDVETRLAGAAAEASRLHITATAEIAANSACDFTLQLRDVTLSDSDPTDGNRRRTVDGANSFKQELERFPLSFSYQDGRVEELCSSPRETVWALNFKRGLLSTTVNNLESLQQPEQQKYEMDVSGYCATDYAVNQTDDVIEVTKTKDLLTCRERGQLVSSLLATPYHSSSKIQSMPLLRSTLECRQMVRERRLSSVVCEERHLFRPFSRDQSGAITHTTVRLTELEVRSSTPSSNSEALTARATAIFDHADGWLQQQTRLGSVPTLLSQLEQATADDVRPQAPRLFAQLVSVLRGAEELELRQLVLSNRGSRRRLLLDALPNLGTPGALAIMRDLILVGSDDLKPNEAERWMTSLAFIHAPSLAMVAALKPLIASRPVSPSTLLGVSTLVHNLLKRNPRLSKEPPVRQVVAGIEKLLGSNCYAKTEEEKTLVLAALKALGNAGVLVHGDAVLRACSETASNSIEIRLAAIRAYRRMPCETVSRSKLMNRLANHAENTEIRIAAYLAIMQCPSHAVVDKLLEILMKETINQVGSFIWTHLTNLQETKDPSKQYIKSLLNNVELSKKFNTDARKFSRYFEKTLFFESMNAGASSEAMVVFSPESYVPRSGMLNLTVDLFGEAINIFEVGARVEGLEDYIEQLVGNNGLYPQEAISDILKTLRGRPESNEINRLADTYNTAKPGSNAFQASSYMKVFGNELAFNSYNDIDALIRSFNFEGPQNIFQLFQRELDWTDNYQFLDTSYTLPTISGLPFTLKASGTAAVSLKTGGALNAPSWTRMNVAGFLKPSAAVEIVGEMGVNAQVARTGLRMTTDLHTSSVLEGELLIDSGKVLSLKIKMPKDKVELLDVHTTFHSVSRNQIKELETLSSDMFHFSACSEAYTAQLLGVNLCSELSYPFGSETAPMFPLSGPLAAKFFVEKTDVMDEFVFEYLHSNVAGVRKSSVMVDTPGSSINRRVHLDYMINYPSKAVRVGVVTPLKSLEVSGSLDLEGAAQHLAAQLKLDGKELFGISGGLLRMNETRAVRYSPSLVLRGPSGPLVRVVGDLVASKSQPKYTIDLNVTQRYEPPLVFQGSLEQVDGNYRLRSTMRSHALDGTLSGTFGYSGSSLLLQTLAEYSLRQGPRHTIAINTRLGRERVGGVVSYKASLDTKVSALPVLNTMLDVEHRASPGEYLTTVQVTRAGAHYVLASSFGSNDRKVSAEAKLLAEHLGIDFKVAFKLDLSTSQKTSLSMLARLSRDRFATGTMEVNHLSEAYRYNYGINTNVTLMSSNYILNVGVRRDLASRALSFVASRTTPGESREISLLASLAEEEDGVTTLEASLRLPGYPSTRVTGRLNSGVGGVFGVSGTLQRDSRLYNASLHYRYAEEHEVKAVAAAPDFRYSALATAKTEGGSYKFRMDINAGRRIRAALSLRPHGEHFKASFELYWNKDVDDSRRVLVDVTRRGHELTASLQYPGRTVRLLAGLTERGVLASLEYAPDRRIIVEGAVMVQPGQPTAFQLSVQTPFPGYTSMQLVFKNKPPPAGRTPQLSFEITGRLEEQVVTLTCRLGWLLEGISSLGGNQGDMSLHLQTPFSGWEHFNLTAIYKQDAQGLQMRLEGSKNEDTCALGLILEKTRVQDAYKIKAGLDFELPLDIVRRGEVGLDLVLRNSSLEVDSLVQWINEDVNNLSVDLRCDYNFTAGMMVDSVLQLNSPFDSLRDIKISMLVSKDSQDLQTHLTVQENEGRETLFHTHFKAAYRSSMSFDGDFQLQCSNCPRLGASIDYLHQTRSTELNVTAQWKDKRTTLTVETRKPSLERNDIVLTLVLPDPIRQYQLKKSSQISYARRELWNYFEISRDQQKVTVETDFRYLLHENGTLSLNGIGKIASPFLGWETARVTQNAVVRPAGTGADFENVVTFTRMNQNIQIVDSGMYRSLSEWKFNRIMTSNTEWFKEATLDLLSDWHGWSGQLSGKTVWDGQISELSFVNAATAGDSATLVNAGLTARWFGQTARTASVVLSSRPDAWDPFVTFSYAPGKVIKLHGSVQKPSAASSSHLKLETPFTDDILFKTSHDIVSEKKLVLMEVTHGPRNKYILSGELSAAFASRLNFTANLQAPIPFIGSNSLALAYRLSDILHVSGRLGHDTRELSLHGTLGTQNGQLAIKTPLQGLDDMTFEYTFLPKRLDIHLITARGNIEVAFVDRSKQDFLEFIASVSTPFRSFKTFTMVFAKPLPGNIFSIAGTLNDRDTIMLNGQYSISAPSSSINLELTTPFQVVRSAQLQFSYSLADHTARFLLSKGRHSLEAEATADLSLAGSTLGIVYRNSLIPGPRSVTVSGTFSVTGPEKMVDLQMIKDRVKFTVEGRAQLAEAASYVTLNVASSIDGFENVAVLSKLTKAGRGPVLTFELTKNNETAKANLKFENTDTSGRVQFDIQTPFKTNHDILLSAEYDVLSSPIRAGVVAERDGVRKVLLATAEWSSSGAHLTLSTPFEGLELLDAQASLHSVEGEREARLVIKRNQERIDMVARAQASWPKSELSVEITTPSEFARRLELQAKYDTSSRTKVILASVSRNQHKFEAMVTGTFATTFAEGTVTIRTPYPHWSEMRCTATYDLSQAEKRLELSYERNGIKKVLSTRGSYNSQFAQLQVATPFEGYEQMGARTFLINNRQKREIGYEANINSHRHRLYVMYEREGQNNIKIRLNTPIHGMHTVEIDARMQSFQDGVGIYMNSNVEGKRSSIQIRTSLGQKTMGVDVDIESHREGFENIKLSGSVNYSKKKKAFTLKSDSKRQKMEFSGFYVIKPKGGVGKLVSKLPFPGLEKVNAKLKYKLGKKNSFKLQYTTKGKKKQVSGDLKYTPTSFVVNLKTPFNGFERITAKAGRSAKKSGAVSAELTLKRGSRLVSVKYNYLFSFKSGDGSIEITSPYEGFEDMKMSLAYQNQRSFRKVKFMARRNSREWLIDSSRTWGDGIEEDNLTLTSPIETIRSLKISRSFNVKNLADMQYYASYERNNRKFTISGTGSIQAKGKKVTLDLVVQTPLDIGQLSANVEYDFTRMPLTLRSGLAAGARNVKLSANIDNTAGTVTITTTEPRLNRVDIAYTANIGRRTRKVSGSITLSDGRKLTIDYDGERRSDQDMSGTLQIISTTYGQGKVTWAYARSGDDVTASFKISSAILNADLSVSVQGELFVERTIVVSGSVSTESFSRNAVLEITYHRRYGLYLKADLTINRDKYLLTADVKTQGDVKTADITYDGKRIKGVKIEGSFQKLRDGHKFSLSYKQGNSYASYTETVSVGPSGKSGSSVSEIRSSFASLSSQKTEVSWDFVAPNRVITYRNTMNGKVYSLEFSGSGQAKQGSYVLTMSMPPLRVSQTTYISEISAELEYDVVNGVFVKAALKNPFEAEMKLKYQKIREKTELFFLAHLMDRSNVLPHIDHRHVEISVNHTKSRSGADIQAMLDTTAFQLGKAELSAQIQRTAGKSIISATYNRGGKVAQIQGEVTSAPGTRSSTFTLNAPIAGFEEVQFSGSYEHKPGEKYAANIDYSRGQRYLRLEASADVSKKSAKKRVKSLGVKTSFKLSSKITRPIEMLVKTDTTITDLGTPKQSGSGKFSGELNGKKVGMTYTVDRDDHGRRRANLVLNLPLKKPYQKIVFTSDASLHSNSISGSVQYGSNKLSGELSWLAGEAGQYGAELRIATPFKKLKTFELEVRGTLNRDQSVDVALHVRYNDLLAHVTGVVRRYAFDLRFETPTLGNFNVKGGVDVNPAEKKYSVHGFATLPTGATAGAEITVKAASLKDLQLTVDVQTPLPDWQRFSVDVAFTNIASSRIIRAALQLPKQKRVEVSMELTNKGAKGLTDLRAGVTTNYLGNVFTFWTNIYRDSAGMKYELEIESPVHIDLPLLGHRH